MITADGVIVGHWERAGWPILDHVDFVSPTGQITGIVGPNGSGKTTLLRALVRATPLSQGSISIDGHDIRSRSPRWIARQVSVVGQPIEPDPSLTAADEVALGGLAHRGVIRAGGAPFDDTDAEALNAVGLGDRVTAGLGTLSGGELQRVALARGLAHGADHVLLDEPTNHLDIRHRLEIVEILPWIALTVVVVLHDLELAARICHHVVLLDSGRVVASGDPRILTPTLLDETYDVRTNIVIGGDGHPLLLLQTSRFFLSPDS